MISRKSESFSRRELLKKLALAGALPLFPAALLAAEDEPKVAQPRSRSTHRILTCNILFDLPEQHGTQADWGLHRRAACMHIIQSRQPDIVCLQEVGRGQNEDFINAFPGFAAFGYEDPYVDTLPKRFQNIKNVILYSRDRYEQTGAGQYWLSDRPLIAGSRMPGTALPRHVTWLRLRERATGSEFRVATTHLALEHPIRVEEAGMLADEAAQYGRCFPQILAGDMNAARTSAEIKVLNDAAWTDTFEAVHGAQEAGSTGHGFREPAPLAGPAAPGHSGKIDYILFRGDVLPVAAEIIRDKVEGFFPSDHYFVSADIELPVI